MTTRRALFGMVASVALVPALGLAASWPKAIKQTWKSAGPEKRIVSSVIGNLEVGQSVTGYGMPKGTKIVALSTSGATHTMWTGTL